ncbi:MAG: NAD-dependent epimerase/dehydratase family protein [Balneolales bacterium]
MEIKGSNDVLNLDMEHINSSLKDEFEQMAGKSLLITGGAGFLGYYLVQSILYWNRNKTNEDKIKITVYDNYIRGVPEWLTSIEQNEFIKLVKHDIINPLPKNMGSFEFIIHAASIASPHYYRKYPLQTMDANVGGLRFLLEYAREQKVKGNPIEGFLFFSTSEIYGDPDPDNIPTAETYRGNVSCTGPRACYDESKRFGETLCVTYAQQFDLPISIARPFNNYGPGLKITDKRVIPDFMRDVLSNHDIIMYSNGSPSRTFCYIADAINGYFKVLVNGKKGEAYNIGVEKPEVSMKELADIITAVAAKHAEYNGKVIQTESSDLNYLVDNPYRRCPDITKARTDLGYTPQITIEEGLLRTFVWYMENQEAVEA